VWNLLEEFVPRVYRFALRLTGDPHAADDLTQETVLRAWRSRAGLRHPRAARVWLFRIAVNLWRDQLRRGRSVVARAGPLPEDHPGPTPSPDRQASGHDDLRRALAALDRLPDRQREVLYLNACEGLPAADIAAILGIQGDAVKASLSLARKKLREELHDLFEDLFPAR
jgi:RNA polymerase sigma-70 factor (ECF subfamily)